MNRARAALDSPNTITNRGILSFGVVRQNIDPNVIWIGSENRPRDTLLEVILLRHYNSVTDQTLNHLEMAAPNLRYLDVTGTGVTEAAVERFKAAKPNCTVIWEKKLEKPK